MARTSKVYKLERHKWEDEISSDKRKSRITILFLATGLACFLLGVIGGREMIPSLTNTTTYTDQNMALFANAYSVMKNQWYFGKDIEELDSKLIENAISGMMMADVDRHTSYMTQEEATKFTNSLSGTLTGVGCSIYSIGDLFLIDKVFPMAPAEAAGMQSGDEIVSVDGVSVKGKTSDEVVSMVRGEEGSQVVITVRRGNQEIPLEMKRTIVQSTVYMEVIDDKTAVLEISSFADSTAGEVATQLSKMESLGIENLIIDLRDDTGGYLSALVSIGNYLLPKGTVIIQESYRDGSVKQEVSKNENPYTFKKMAVLVNEYTASAAEVLTAALKEGIGATVIGTKTYGKGTMQVPMVLGNGGVLKYTTAQWLTTNGNTINGTGIVPDIVVENETVYRNNVEIAEGESYGYDSVSTYNALAQTMLKYIGYSVDREDGYFSKNTETALRKYESEHNLTVDGILDNETYQSLVVSNFRHWFESKDEQDNQLNAALEWVRK